MDSGEPTKLEYPRGVQQGSAIGPALFCLPLQSALRRVREEYELQGVKAYVYLDDITIVAHEISTGTMGVMSFLERKLTARGINLKPGMTGCAVPEGPRTHAGRYIDDDRSWCPHRGRGEGFRWLGYPSVPTISR